MLQWLKQLFTPPFFDLSGNAQNIKVFLTISFSVSVPIGIYTIATSPTPQIALAVFVVLWVMHFVTMIVLRRGHVQIAGLTYSFVLWLSLTSPAIFLNGTLASPIFVVYPLLILGAGLFLRPRVGYLLSILSVITLWGLFVIEQNGFVPPLPVAVSVQDRFIYHFLGCTIAVLLLFMTSDSIQRSLRRVERQKNELLERNRALKTIRKTLEKRVSDRTAEILHQKQYYEALVKNSPIAVVALDLDRRVVSCNPAFEKLFGYVEKEVTGECIDDLITDEETKVEAQAYTELVSSGNALRETGRRQRKDGNCVDVEIFGVPVQVNGSQIGVLALYNDISERVQAEKALRESKDKLRFLASHDPLTHLPNRFLFDERLAHALSWAKRASQQVAILFMDLDGFKSVNDTFGHSKGDQLLQEAAERLQDCMRESDTVARSGGDEFTIILENVAQAEDVVLVAKKIIACFQEPFFVDGNSTRITTSIGISLYPQDGEDGEILLKNADKAMYNAKSRGKDGFTFYSTNRR